MITKQVIQLILIMLVGIDVCIRVVLVWEKTGVPGENPPVWLGDQMNLLSTYKYDTQTRSHIHSYTHWYILKCVCVFKVLLLIYVPELNITHSWNKDLFSLSWDY